MSDGKMNLADEVREQAYRLLLVRNAMWAHTRQKQELLDIQRYLEAIANSMDTPKEDETVD